MRLPLPSAKTVRRPKRQSRCLLQADGWSDRSRRSLQELIGRGAGQGLPVVFDFDNTIIRGDVGEAVLTWLAAEDRLKLDNLTQGPALRVAVPGKGRVGIEGCSDAMEYYEALLTPTVHGPTDPAPLANGYVWATQALAGLSVAEVLSATGAVFRLGQRPEPCEIQAGASGLKYPAPRFYEEVVELIAWLLKLRYEVWIVSASNVWSVRWMVLHGLNPLLEKYGASRGLLPEQVIGLATLLEDSRGRLYKDSVLAHENRNYSELKGRLMHSLQLTRHLQYPAPVYSGKVACILDAIGETPYFCAGDSPSDHPMLRISRHRLWLARPEKPQALQATRKLIGKTGAAGWIIQTCAAFRTSG